MGKKGLTPGRINRLFGVLLAIFLGVGAYLYWFGYIRELGLALVIIIALVAGVLFTFGTRMAQRDGFLDGYTRAKNGLEEKKK
jgi:hypothetical protein